MINPNHENPLKGLSKYEKELELAKKSKDTSKIFHVLLNLGKLCYEIEAYELGLNYILDAIELSKQYPNFPRLYEFHKLLGDFNFKQGQLDDAYKAYNRANKELPKNKFFKLLAENNFKMGKICELRNENKKAIRYFKEAEKIFEKLGLHVERSRIYNLIGLIYLKKIDVIISIFQKMRKDIHDLEKSRFKKAKKNFRHALMILDQHGLIEVEKKLYNQIKANLEIDFKEYR